MPNATDNCIGVANTSQSNVDDDYHGDLCDCLPNDDLAFQLPFEVRGEAFLGPALVFDAPLPAPDTTYQVIRGDLDDLPVGSTTAEACADLADTYAHDPEAPAAGRGFFYLIRGVNACGTGTLGKTSSGVARATTAVCPAPAVTAQATPTR